MSLSSPLFIFCQHRTGSTLLRNMLNLHSEIAMTVDEMVVLNPWQRTLFDVLKKHDLTTRDGLRDGLKRLYDCEAYGAFWRYFDRDENPFEEVLQEVEARDRSAWGVVDVFLDRCRRSSGKKRAGAKNFAHFSFLPQVVEHYPDAKCVFLVRNPMAMCASKLKSPGTRGRKKDHPLFAPMIHFVILWFFMLEFNRTARAIERYRKTYDIAVVRYEDLVHEPRAALQDLCQFCGLPFEEEMLNASGKESSHTGASKSGVDPRRATDGVKTLKPWERWLVSAMTVRARAALGYGGETKTKTNENPGYLKGY